jgi:hypothetical protein
MPDRLDGPGTIHVSSFGACIDPPMLTFSMFLPYV